MNVCFVSQEYPPETVRGGVGVQTWNKARSLASLGHEIHVLSCGSAPGEDLSTAEGDGVTIHRMTAPGADFPVYETATYWLGYSWLVLRHLNYLMESNQFDLIDFPEYGAEGFAYQLDRIRWNWVPVVVQLHAPLAMFAEHIGWPAKDSEFYRVGTFMEELSIRRADALMACSVNIADFTAQRYQVSRELIDVVHCGVDAESFRPPEPGERETKRPTVLFVGNIALNKGVRTVIEAVLGIRTKYPDIRLQVAGTGSDDLTQQLKSLVRASGAGENVEFLGFVHRNELPALYRAASVFCSPAQYEGGVANVYLESMASGCPVIASTAGAAPEAVADGETGLLVPPGDVDAVTAALDQVLGNSKVRNQMGLAGRRQVEQYFAMDKYINRVLSTYRKAIDRSEGTLRQLKE